MKQNIKKANPSKEENITLVDCYKALTEMREKQVLHLKAQANLLYELYLKTSGNNQIPGMMELINYEPNLDSKYS